MEKSSCGPLFPEGKFEDKILKNVTGISHVKGFLVVLVICLFVLRLISFSVLYCKRLLLANDISQALLQFGLAPEAKEANEGP